MKLKIKYSKTEKFIVNVESGTLGNLKDEIRKSIVNIYKETVSEPLTVSLNGLDPLLGSDDNTLASLGIVPGDMLTILPPSANAVQEKSPAPLSQASAKSSTATKSASSSSTIQKPQNSQMDEKLAHVAGDERAMGKVSLLEVKDGHPSLSLKNLFTKCSPGSASQAVNLIVHLTMLECGFHLESSLEIPPGWKEMIATFQYSHNLFPAFQSSLVLVTMGEVKQILATFPQQENEISVKIKVGDYIKDSHETPIQANNLIRVAQLARTLRDSLLHPLQVAAHEALGVPAPWHIAGLPHEILVMIASLLEARCVLNLGQTCQRLNAVMKDNKVWHNLYKRDFKSLYSSIDNYNLIDWKAKYKVAAEHVKQWKSMHDEELEYILPGMHPPPPPFGPPYPTVPYYPEIPRPRGPSLYPPGVHPHPTPNPFFDPDSPYFGGEIPPLPNPFPNSTDPFGVGPMRPRPQSPFNPPFMPGRPRNPRGPRFDYF